ncbi:MAG: hypothetical protein MMC33_003442 [Icmadophila ericetorum]|nr:hypothetical protein [Icmadophila ericetorum]
MQAPYTSGNVTGNVPTPEDWLTHQERITQLYLTENKTLRYVMTYMKEQHGFNATAKIYKSQFTQWGVFKNNREQEAIPILRKRLEHSRKPIDVQLRGRCVQLHRLENYAKRKKITNNDII